MKPRIEPVRWTPPPAPPRARARRGPEPFPEAWLIPLPGHGPEDVVVDAQGRLLTGLADGRVLRIDPDTEEAEVLADTGGRPLGLEVLPDGRVLVCDSPRGLLRLDPDTGALETLVGEVGGVPLRFCSNAVAASDGTVYFSDSSRRYTFEHWRADIYEHTATGRLFRWRDGEVETLLDGLAFANGVALAADESYVVVAQTGAYELTRYWLTGPRAGTAEPWVTGLPGFPDNIARGASGLVWVTLPSARDPRLDWLLPRPPWLRRVAWALPDRLAPKPHRTVWVLGVDPEGRIVRDLQLPGQWWSFATGVAEHGDRLYLASIAEASVAVLELG
jgi:sugar lactone lactonase YvrE